MDDRTRGRLTVLCCELGEACAKQVRAAAGVALDDEPDLRRSAAAYWSKAAAAALQEIARLVLLSAHVVRPDEPTPREGFEPVTVQLDAGLIIVVDPSPDGPKVSFMRRLD